ncbi:DUF4314 domain-containing protein [Sporofaciens sp. SGI.106]|uniref:DUF4314 domain-containing protein n=1 Tax=Sporofaciens sp. SGI.106 TaxID=3420568 RepID=UPI003CFE927F
MFGVTQKELERLRQQYPKGTRLKLISMEDPQGVPEGTVGEVELVDDIGQIHVRWETGSGLALIPEVDRFQKV